MTDKTIDLTEERFNRIKSRLTAAQIKDPLYFCELSKSYENEDLDLTYRILLHAFRLDNKSQQIKSRLTKIRRLKKDVDDKLTLEQIDNIIVLEQSVDKNPDTSEEQKPFFIKSYFKIKLEDFLERFKQPLFVFVLLPWLFYALYLTLFASPIFESSSQIILKQPDSVATMDPTMAMLTGLGVSNGNTDVELVKAYILSSDMLTYLDKKLELKKHYVSDTADFFSRLSAGSSFEDFNEYYKQHVIVEIDDISKIISIKVQAFEPIYAKELNDLLSNYQMFYMNLRGFHWNIKGRNFFELHVKFEELYNDALIQVDEIAERVLTLSVIPVHTFSNYIEVSDIKAEENVTDGEEAIASVLKALTILLTKERAILTIAGDANDEGTASLMSDYITQQEKLVWMLSAYQN